MSRDIIQTALYQRKPTAEEIAAGRKKTDMIFITVPIKDVILGTDCLCGAIMKRSIKHTDGLRYYYRCVNFSEVL